MEIIKPKKNAERFGKTRLFSEETWPGKTRDEIEDLSSQVIDTFHALAKEAGLFIQWKPAQGAFCIQKGNKPSISTLEGLLNEAYASCVNYPRLKSMGFLAPES